MESMAALFALMSALSFGTADFLGGYSSRRNATTATVAWSQAAGLAAVLIVAPIIGAENVRAGDLIWGALSGVSGALGVMVLFKGLSTGLAAVVSPLAALVGAAVPVLFGVIWGERPPLLTWGGVALSLPAIALLSMEPVKTRKQVLPSVELGLVSGLLFGGFFILISQSSGESGMWPLASARITTVPLFLVITRIRRSPIALAPGSRRITILSGVLDMAANVFYLLAFRSGYLIYAVVLSALYPAPTVVLQRVFIQERLSPPRIFGMALAIAGAVLIGIGG